MEQTEENITWAIKKLFTLSDMYGFPHREGNDAYLRLLARGFLRIVDDQREHKWQVEEKQGAEWVRVWKGTPFISAKDTADWLIEQIVETQEKFPSLIEMRRLYEGHDWRCADRRLSGSMDEEPKG